MLITAEPLNLLSKMPVVCYLFNLVFLGTVSYKLTEGLNKFNGIFTKQNPIDRHKLN